MGYAQMPVRSGGQLQTAHVQLDILSLHPSQDVS